MLSVLYGTLRLFPLVNSSLQVGLLIVWKNNRYVFLKKQIYFENGPLVLNLKKRKFFKGRLKNNRF